MVDPITPAQVPPPAVPPVVPPVVQPVVPAVVPPAVVPPAVPPVVKPNENQPPLKVVPEKYDLKIPDGSKLDAKHLETISAFAKEKGYSNEEAQALLERDNGILTAHQQKFDADVKATRDSWEPAAKADKEIGGEAFPKNVELARRVVTRFGSESFKKLMDDSGFGNHPEVLRFVWKIGQAMSEDQFVQPGAPPGGKKTIEEMFYGGTEKPKN